MYLLKQKFPENKVSSLFLWTRAMMDIKAQEPWQKLQKNTLMILQIIILVLIALALCRPYFSDLFASDYNIIIIDSSMSMQATDKEKTRFEFAKAKAISLVSSAKPGSYTCIINMASSATFLCNFDSNKSNVLSKLDKLKVTNEKTDYLGAKSLVLALLQSNKVASVYLLSDTKFSIPGITVKFIDTSGNGWNYAVNSLTHTIGKKNITAFTQVSNYSLEPVTLPISLLVDKNVFDAKNLDLSPGETKGIFWTQIPLKSTFIEAKIDKADFLTSDNTAYDTVNSSKPIKVVLVTKENIFLEKSVMTYNNLTLFKMEASSNSVFKGYDLYIFDGFLPQVLPTDGNIMIFNPPANNYFNVSGEISPSELKRSEHSVFKYVDDYSFAMKKSKKLEVPNWGEGVLESKEGNLIFAGEFEKKRFMVFGFDLHNTDLVLKPVFPVIINNSLEWLLPMGIKNVEKLLTGDSAYFNIYPKTVEAKIIDPDKKKFTIFPPYPVKLFDEAALPGIYTLEQNLGDGTDMYYFAVNPPVETESNIKVKTIETPGELQKDKAKVLNQNFLNIQLFMILLILIFLLIEWWVYAYGN